ncbi:uncharacterized protein BP5553_09801 [Venustampulla echinocandica]|uniref:Uncharacterized protein n=1 Tax=Venustampulla echinocandica TaxID=2656787 RepID=A0A370TAS6_9HELO|nr:uncharacterized protein BP5553_09801 [Venustampulla echinocandica]RDL31012.1 hypothetical protein BP5553_09801 [Venustampulla echinocandica]
MLPQCVSRRTPQLASQGCYDEILYVGGWKAPTTGFTSSPEHQTSHLRFVKTVQDNCPTSLFTSVSSLLSLSSSPLISSSLALFIASILPLETPIPTQHPTLTPIDVIHPIANYPSLVPWRLEPRRGRNRSRSICATQISRKPGSILVRDQIGIQSQNGSSTTRLNRRRTRQTAQDKNNDSPWRNLAAIPIKYLYNKVAASSRAVVLLVSQVNVAQHSTSGSHSERIYREATFATTPPLNRIRSQDTGHRRIRAREPTL